MRGENDMVHTRHQISDVGAEEENNSRSRLISEFDLKSSIDI